MKVNSTLEEKKVTVLNKTIMKKNSPNQKLIDGENRVEQESNEASLDNLLDDCIFPSPIPISKEEAMRETQCHFARQGFRDMPNNGGCADDGSEDSRYAGFLNARPMPRREVEKPPRLQKQMSRDRIPSSNRQIASADTPHNGGDCHSQASSTECLDSTGVDVHEFLVRALQSNPRDRNILLKLERDMTKFCRSRENFFMRFPEMTSYHRMLVHRVAAYFGMDHNIDAKGKSVIINKTENTRVPEKKFRDYIILADDNSNGKEEDGRRSILKRMKNCQSLDQVEVQVSRGTNWRESKQRSYEEREDHYERTRARIFQEHQQNEQLRFKDGMQWRNRPWNSADLDYSAENGHSSPRVNLSGKSGMTILSRHSNLKKDSISSSSSTSSLFQAQHNDSTAVDHSVNSDSDHHVDHQRLHYPHSGIPYVNTEDQQGPMYQPQPPLVFPHFMPPPVYNNAYPSDSTRMPPPHEMNGFVQNDFPPPDIITHPSMNVFPPQSHLIYPYQPAPMPLYAYSLPPIQHQEHSTVHPINVNGFPTVDHLSNEIYDMKLNGNNFTQQNSNQNDLADANASSSDLITDSSNSDDARSRDHDDTSASHSTSPRPDEKTNSVEDVDSDAAVRNISSSPTSIHSAQADSKNDEPDENNEAETSQEQDFTNNKPCVSATVSTSLGSITYYTPEQNRFPIQTGSSGQPVFVPPASPVYPVGMVPYGFGKLSQPQINSNPIGGSPEYFMPGNPGLANTVPNFIPPQFYYMVNNNQRMGPYQTVPFQNVPFFYSPSPGAYPQPPMPQPPTDLTIPAHGIQKEDSKPTETNFYPMLLSGSVNNIDDPKLNSFAARFNSKLVQLSDEDDKENMSKDIFLVFTCLKVARKAQDEANSMKTEFHLMDVYDQEKADLLRDLYLNYTKKP